MTTYVSEIQHALSHLQAQAETTKEAWQDCVAEKFYDLFINEYDRLVSLFIIGYRGTDSIQGMGLEELMMFIDDKQAEMASI